MYIPYVDIVWWLFYGHIVVIDTQESRYFELDRVSGSVTLKRAIPEDDLLQPVTMVIRVSRLTLAKTYYHSWPQNNSIVNSAGAIVSGAWCKIYFSNLFLKWYFFNIEGPTAHIDLPLKWRPCLKITKKVVLICTIWV